MVHWAGDTPKKKHNTQYLDSSKTTRSGTYLGRVTSSNAPPSCSYRESMMVNDDDDDDNASCLSLPTGYSIYSAYLPYLTLDI